jgi:hypothetical protein
MKLFEFFTDEFSNSAPSYDDRENYYLQFVESTELSFYLNLYNAEDTNKVIPSPHRIKLFDIDFNTNYESLTKSLGNPRFKSSYKKEDYDISILFYRKQFYNYKAILQYHLINDKVVLGSLTVPFHNKKINKIFGKLLAIKYNEIISKEEVDKSFTIQDEENNKLIFKNYFYPSLLYIGNNTNEIISMMKNSSDKESFLTQKHSSDWYHHL